MSPQLFRRLMLRTLARARARGPVRAGDGTRRVCLFKPDGIGDFVLALGALRRLAETHGEGNCEIVVSPPVGELARAEFPQARVISLPLIGAARGLSRALRGWLKWRRSLAGLTADTVYCLRHHRNLEEECALFWMNARRVVGLENSRHAMTSEDQAALPPVLTASAPRPASAPASLCLELECHRTLLRLALNREAVVADVMPKITAAQPELGQRLLVAPYSSAVLKDYPDEMLAQALGLLRAPVPIVLAGSPAQRGRLERLRLLLQARCAAGVDILPDGSLVEFARAVATARAVLTVDTAAAHLATSLDKPAVILHNGTHHGEFGPWQRSPRQRWLVKPLDCFGCGGRCVHERPECLQGIEPGAVAVALGAALVGD